MDNSLAKITYKGKVIDEPDIVVNDMMSIAVEGLLDNRAGYVDKDFEEVLLNYELMSRRLDFANEPEHKAAYDFGRMYALTVLIKEASALQRERVSIDGMKYKSKYLEKALELVESMGSISSKELADALDMKNRSDISNFMNRVKDYKLFRSVKVGSKKYYSLSSKGRKYINYLKAKGSDSLKSNDVDFLLLLLDNLGSELKKDNPSTFSLLIETNREVPNNTLYQSKILKQKIKNIIDAYDERLKEQMYKISYTHITEKYETSYETYYYALDCDTYLNDPE